MIDLTIIFLKLYLAERPLDPAMRREFEAELQCSIGFGGLRPIRRVFV